MFTILTCQKSITSFLRQFIFVKVLIIFRPKKKVEAF